MKLRPTHHSSLKPAAHIQDCQEDCVTTANRGLNLEEMPRLLVFQDSVKIASRQFSDGSKTALRWVRQCCDGVVTASRIKKIQILTGFFLLRQSYDGQDSVTTSSRLCHGEVVTPARPRQQERLEGGWGSYKRDEPSK